MFMVCEGEWFSCVDGVARVLGAVLEGEDAVLPTAAMDRSDLALQGNGSYYITAPKRTTHKRKQYSLENNQSESPGKLSRRGTCFKVSVFTPLRLMGMDGTSRLFNRHPRAHSEPRATDGVE